MSNSFSTYKTIIRTIYGCLLVSLFFACNTTKRATIKELKSEKSVEDLSANLTKNNLDFKWLSGKMATEFVKGEKKKSFKSTFRIRKDSVIWMSITALGIEAARVIITPDSVKLLDKLHKKYFIGDFSYISKLLKTELNFAMLQALLVGNEYWIAEKKQLFSSIDADRNAYLLSTVRKRKLRKMERKDKEKVAIAQGVWVKPEIYRIGALLINDIANKRRLKVNYTNFKELYTQQIATRMNAEIESLDGNYNLGIKLSKLKINKPYKLSFKIPASYAKIR